MELAFNTGDIVYVYGDMDEDGFFMGEVNGVRGLVPSNFLSEATAAVSATGPAGDASARHVSRTKGGEWSTRMSHDEISLTLCLCHQCVIISIITIIAIKTIHRMRSSVQPKGSHVLHVVTADYH